MHVYVEHHTVNTKNKQKITTKKTNKKLYLRQCQQTFLNTRLIEHLGEQQFQSMWKKLIRMKSNSMWSLRNTKKLLEMMLGTEKQTRLLYKDDVNADTLPSVKCQQPFNHSMYCPCLALSLSVGFSVSPRLPVCLSWTITVLVWRDKSCLKASINMLNVGLSLWPWCFWSLKYLYNWLLVLYASLVPMEGAAP